MIYMKKSDQFKMDIIHKLMRGQLSLKRAQEALNLSERSVYRLLKKYRQEGPCLLLHGNKCRPPVNKKMI